MRLVTVTLLAAFAASPAMAADQNEDAAKEAAVAFLKAVKAKDAAGKEHTAAIDVMPDYLTVGSDTDFVRVPTTPMTAARIADAFGCARPTRKVVDAVYAAAAV